jgi:hypothetical protein
MTQQQRALEQGLEQALVPEPLLGRGLEQVAQQLQG